jgi:acetolactate synthase-1/3 small subunit
VIDDTPGSFVFELTETSERIDSFVAEMREHGLLEAARSGVVGMMRGAGGA